MQALPSNLSQLDQTRWWQKGIALILLVATLTAVVVGVNAITPAIVAFCTNIWKILLIGTPTLFALVYIAKNPFLIWSMYKTLSWNLTKFAISLDKLSVMDRYADYLELKAKKMQKRILTLNTYKISVGRKIEKAKQDMADNLKRGDSALRQGQKAVASSNGVMANADKQTIAAFQPLYDRIDKEVVGFQEVLENWLLSITNIRYVNERKRTEYETLKEAAKICGEADEFLHGDTEAAKIYNESIRQMEEDMSGYTATIDQFDAAAKPILDSARVDKQMNLDEGLKALEEYRTNGSLMLPDLTQRFLAPADNDAAVTVSASGKKYFSN